MLDADPDLIIHAGDVVVPSGAAEDYPAKFFRPYAELIKCVAMYPCIGNHDWNDYQAEPLLDVFVLPENGPQRAPPERNYWFDFGDVRFVCFDSNATFAELQSQVAPWLESVLAEAGDRWKIALFHHPAYTAGKYAPSGKIRELITPLFDRYGVHLAVSGHNHMYERSHPLYAGAVVDAGEGTVYVVSGIGGDHLYTPRGPKTETQAVRIDGVYGFTVVDVTPEMLSVRQIAVDGTNLDSFVIARSEPTTTREEPP
jgi:3',5'-cyclic AMP phosphodiesterase CpdA